MRSSLWPLIAALKKLTWKGIRQFQGRFRPWFSAG